MRRVLVCDDDITISEVVAIILVDSNLAEVYTIPDCDNIIEKIEELKPNLIFMDNKIPTDGGVVATQTIKNHPVHKFIPVVYFTANEDIEKLAENAGADFTLSKPFSIDQLEDVVNKAFKVTKAEVEQGTKNKN
jgi:two-component system cell cycle response regulator DivK